MKGLTGNQLKLIAVIAMTADHIGFVLLPQLQWLRMIGRLAYPIFAYMIAEGCRHTRSMGKYLLSTVAVALVCQSVEWFVAGSLYQCIMVTFSLSIGLIWLVQKAQQSRSPLWVALAGAGVLAVYGFCELLPGVLGQTDFAVDYGFWGVLVALFVYLGKNKQQRLLLLTLGLAGMAISYPQIQWLALLTVPLLALYNGQRGKARLKWFFYLYYPAHLACIHLVAFLL